MKKIENNLIFEKYTKSLQKKDSPKPKQEPTKPFKKEDLKPVEPKALKPGAKFCAKHEVWYDEMKECATCAKHRVMKKKGKKLVKEETDITSLSASEKEVVLGILEQKIAELSDRYSRGASMPREAEEIIQACQKMQDILTGGAYAEPSDMSDVEADADTLKSAGWGSDEDYGPGADETY